MSSLIAHFSLRTRFVAAVAILALAPAARAQNGTWSGTSGIDPLWSDAANWFNNTPPTTGLASFNGHSTGILVTTNDNTNMSLTGIAVGGVPNAAGTTPISIAGNALTIGASGISMSGATQDLSITTNLSLAASQTWTDIGNRALTIGASGNSLALSTTTANTLTFGPTAVGTTTVNSNIADGAAPSSIIVTPTTTTAAVTQFSGTNTYSGGTTISAKAEIVQVGSSSAFGTGPLTFAPAPSGTSTVSVIEATGGAETIGNAVVVNFGFSFAGSNNLTLNGPVTLSQGRAITYNGAAGTLLTFNGPVTIGTAGAAAGTLTTSVASGTSTASSAIVFNGVISEVSGVTSGAVVLLSNGNGTAVSSDQFNNQNTFSGGITANGGGATVIAGVSSTLSGSTLVSGPFGIGAVTVANAVTPARLQAANGPQMIANNFTLTNSLQVQGANNVTLSGVVSGAGGLLKMGTNTLFLTGANTYTSSSPGTVISGGTVSAMNPSGSATGTSVVTVIGTGAVGTGGTLGGGNSTGTVGFISSNVTISSTTPASQGGTLSPGASSTLTAMGGSVVTWDPLGTYQFAYDASATGTAPVGGASTLLKGTGTATLNLGNLTPSAQFTLNLSPVNTATSSAPVTYTIADFSAVAGTPITAPAGIVGTDLTPFFNITGAFQPSPAPTVTLNNGNQITVTLTPVPEPAFILAACGGLTALAGWRRTRRRP